MTYTPIPKGTENWDVPVNAAFESQDTRLSVAEDDLVTQAAAIASNSNGLAATDAGLPDTPQSRGFINWSLRPENCGAGTAPGPGFISMIRIQVAQAATINNIWTCQTAVGATLTAGQNSMGIYDANGNLLGTTADLTTRWTTDLDLQSYALTSPISVGPGNYYVAINANGTTRPTFMRGLSSGATPNFLSAGLTNATQAWGVFTGGATSLPATLNFATRTSLSAAYWAALS